MDLIPVFSLMFLRWEITVWMLINSLSAMILFEWPRATRRSTSFSREVSSSVSRGGDFSPGFRKSETISCKSPDEVLRVMVFSKGDDDASRGELSAKPIRQS